MPNFVFKKCMLQIDKNGVQPFEYGGHFVHVHMNNVYTSECWFNCLDKIDGYLTK
jgi:hypothetical protein